jgi:hypothetical protein
MRYPEQRHVEQLIPHPPTHPPHQMSKQKQPITQQAHFMETLIHSLSKSFLLNVFPSLTSSNLKKYPSIQERVENFVSCIINSFLKVPSMHNTKKLKSQIGT